MNRLYRFAGISALACLAAGGLNAQHVPGTPSADYLGAPCLGSTMRFSLGADPGTYVAWFFGTQPGPIGTLPIGNDAIALLGGLVPPTGQRFETQAVVPNFPGLIGTSLFHLAIGFDPAQPARGILEGPSGVLTVCGTQASMGSVILVDDDVIDSGISTIEAAAQRLGVAKDVLVNDNGPVEFGNPWLPWATLGAGDVVTLPMGSAGDPGLFAVPSTFPFTLAQLVAGTIPQSQLDPIPNVMPLDNQDLARLVGRTLLCIVWDGDISVNYRPLLANLQGARNGLLAFTVLDVVNPGTISESGSSTSYFDLVVRIEPPLTAANALGIPVLDRSTGSLQITEARMQGNLLVVEATSAAAPRTTLTVTVDGFTFESPMVYDPRTGSYGASFFTPVSLAGRRVTVSSDEGGSYTEVIANS